MSVVSGFATRKWLEITASVTVTLARINRINPVYLAFGLAVPVFLLRLYLLNSGGAPTGADPGNWLALARELGGERVKAATVPYPPLVPSLARLLSLFFPPLPTMNLLAATSSVAMSLPFFMMLQLRTGNLWAGLFTLASLFLGYSAEMMAWGGYPQLLSQAFVLSAFYFLGRALIEQRTSFLLLAAVSGSLSLSASISGAAYLAVAGPIFVSLIAFRQRRSATVGLLWGAAWGVLTVILSALSFESYVTTLLLRQGRPWNPQGYTLLAFGEAFSHVFSEWPAALRAHWLLLATALGLIVYCVRRSQEKSFLESSAVSLLLSSLGLFIATVEERTLSMFQFGLLAGGCVVVKDLFDRLASRPGAFRWVSAVLLVAVVSLASLTVGFGQRRTGVVLSWYRVVDADVLEALDWLKRDVPPSRSVVVASSNPRGYGYAWWVEGYAGRPAYNSTDPAFLIFKEEKRHTAIATAFLNARTSKEIVRLASSYSIGYVFLDKKVTRSSPQMLAGGFVASFENSRIVVLKSFMLLEEPAPFWWPAGGVGPHNALTVTPPAPREGRGGTDASYYRHWYVFSRRALSVVLGYDEADQASILERAVSLPVVDLWQEIDALNRARQSGVVGDLRFPEYHFRLWLAFGSPSSWPNFALDCGYALRIHIPPPPAGVSTKAAQNWYKCNRAKLAVVYYGREDRDPEIFASWTGEHDDAALRGEILLMREAFQQGVRGSPDRPFADYRAWLRKRAK